MLHNQIQKLTDDQEILDTIRIFMQNTMTFKSQVPYALTYTSPTVLKKFLTINIEEFTPQTATYMRLLKSIEDPKFNLYTKFFNTFTPLRSDSYLEEYQSSLWTNSTLPEKKRKTLRKFTAKYLPLSQYSHMKNLIAIQDISTLRTYFSYHKFPIDWHRLFYVLKITKQDYYKILTVWNSTKYKSITTAYQDMKDIHTPVYTKQTMVINLAENLNSMPLEEWKQQCLQKLKDNNILNQIVKF